MAATIHRLPVRGFKSKKKLGPPKQTFREWSNNRPQLKAMADPLGIQMAELLDKQVKERKGWAWDMADSTGLSEGTIRKLKARETRRPQGMTLQQIAKALGGELVFVSRRKDK